VSRWIGHYQIGGLNVYKYISQRIDLTVK